MQTTTSNKATSDIDRTVGTRIATLRKAKGHTQTALGAALGVTFQQVQKYEKGQNRVGAGRLRDIATFLEIPVSTLFADEADGAFDGLVLLAEPGAIELLKAYAEIRDPVLRRGLIGAAKQFVRAPALTDQSEAA